MAKASGGTRLSAVQNTTKSISKKVDTISFPLFGDTNTMAVKVNDVFKLKYQKDEAEKIRASVKPISSFSKPIGKYEYIEVSKLHPTQEHIGANNLKTIASIKFDANNVPYGVLRNGKIYVIDGHHRVAAAILKGNKKIRMLVS